MDKLQISAKLLELGKNNKKSFDCSHKNFDRMTVATIVHELTHVKDNFEKISSDADYQRIAGVKKVKAASSANVMNHNAAASPDPYEFKSMQESLAVNVEYMVMDQEFPCRKPATAKFLARKMGIKLKDSCSVNFKILTQSAYLEDNYLHTSVIDPHRVYQIHYLFAGKGKGLMSRWGHAMFRLVMCAPHRKAAGPECLRDVSHHLVLSYRAHMTDLNISYTKGIVGKYPSQLFIMRFHEVQQEYTKFELRDLFSIPMNFTQDQKKDFIDLTLERFWDYQGKYYFLGNNCGTEAKKHAQFALDEEHEDLIRSTTPLRAYKDIIKKENELSLVQVEGLKRKELINKGLLIEGLSKELSESYQYLRGYGLYQEKDLEKFLKTTTAVSRYEVYEKFFGHENKMESAEYIFSDNMMALPDDEQKKVVMRLIYLERYLMGRFLLGLPKKAMKLMNKDEDLKKEVLKMGESMKTLALQPWDVVKGSYGVPTKEEFENKYPVFVEGRSASLRLTTENQMENLNGLLGGKHFKEELVEIEQYKAMKKMTSDLFLKVNSLSKKE